MPERTGQRTYHPDCFHLTFTQQLLEGLPPQPSDGVETKKKKETSLEDRDQEEEEHQRPPAALCAPDNWDAVPEGTITTGSYFRGLLPKLNSSTGGGKRALGGGGAYQEDEGRMRGEGRKVSPSSRKLTPQEREAELDKMVSERVLLGLEEQREATRKRLEMCKVQRDVERLKLHQRMKSRMELQIASSQKINDRAALESGLIDSLTEEFNATHLHQGESLTSARRREKKDEANANYVKYNLMRIEQNLAHRDSCMESLRDRQRMRHLLEDKAGTLYAKRKHELLGTMGITGAEATFARCPTSDEVHRRCVHTANEATRRNNEAAEVSQEVRELNALDELLWEQRRERKGKKSQRIRELPFEVSTSFSRSKSPKEGSR